MANSAFAGDFHSEKWGPRPKVIRSPKALAVNLRMFDSRKILFSINFVKKKVRSHNYCCFTLNMLHIIIYVAIVQRYNHVVGRRRGKLYSKTWDILHETFLYLVSVLLTRKRDFLFLFYKIILNSNKPNVNLSVVVFVSFVSYVQQMYITMNRIWKHWG